MRLFYIAYEELTPCKDNDFVQTYLKHNHVLHCLWGIEKVNIKIIKRPLDCMFFWKVKHRAPEFFGSIFCDFYDFVETFWNTGSISIVKGKWNRNLMQNITRKTLFRRNSNHWEMGQVPECKYNSRIKKKGEMKSWRRWKQKSKRM